MRSLLKESKVFGIALFGDGTTIQKIPMMIFLGCSPNNPYKLLDIVDCTSEMAKGGKKDAKYIGGLLKPIISRIEQTKDPNNQKTDHRGVVDLLLFDGASNVQNAAKLASITYPCITVVHGFHCCSSRTYPPKCQCSNVYSSFQNGAEISLDQLVTVLMP